MSNSLAESERVLALAEEIAAISRCGMPLEQGLAAIASETPGKTGALIHAISEDLRSGKSLEAAIENHAEFSPLYRAVVAAGIRSGNLAAAMERLCDASRSITELHRQLRFALIYPFLVISIAYTLFLVATFNLFPPVQSAMSDYRLQEPDWPIVPWLQNLARNWGWLPPLAALGLFAWVWRRGALPWLGRAVDRLHGSSRVAIFSELLALLVDHGEPLDSAVELAANATGHRPLMDNGQRLAEQLRSGATPHLAATRMGDHVPNLLAWSLKHSDSPDQLSIALRRAANGYRRRAENSRRWCELYLPSIMTVVIGGGATLAFALSMLVPWTQILHELVALVNI